MPLDKRELAGRFMAHLPFDPLPGQASLVMSLAAFVSEAPAASVFVLNGYAGTGKTSVVGAFVRALREAGVKAVVLAPTGRAAKVAGGMSSGGASTIHRRIYHRQGGEGATGHGAAVVLSSNRDRDTVFVVDEASLITDSGYASLLRDLIRYVYSAPGCRMLLVGDTAQLPPVGQEDSPAMNVDRLRAYGLDPVTFTLDMPVRQRGESGILHNAGIVRRALEQKNGTQTTQNVALPPLELNGFDDIRLVDGYEMPDSLSSSWSSVGVEETLIITRSNRRANEYNMAIRNQVIYAESPLQQGDRLVISKNDYYWSGRNKLKSFIANGDVAVVEWVGRAEKKYGRYFCDVELFFPATEDRMQAKLMLRSLMTEGPSIPKAEMDRFFAHVLAGQEGKGDYEKIMAASQDPYFNAIQAKYAYCVTCHKAQGGQWRHVYVDMAGLRPENLDASYLRWLYTALTRATERVYLINPPESLVNE